MNDPSIREVLEAKMAELQAQIAEIQEALNGLELAEELAGMSSNTPQPRSTTRALKDENKSNAQLLIETISDSFKTISTIAEEMSLSPEGVRSALYQKRVQKGIQTRDQGGKKSYRYFRIKLQDTENDKTSTLRAGVMDMLSSSPGKVFQTFEVANRLEGKVPSEAINFRGSVAATLSILVKDRRIKKAKTGGYYVGTS